MPACNKKTTSKASASKGFNAALGNARMQYEEIHEYLGEKTGFNAALGNARMQ